MNAPVKVKPQRSEPQNTPREVRAAYVYFHEKRTKNAAGVLFVYGPDHPKAGQPNPRYSATIMFPKLSADPSQCANYAWLWALAVEAARKMWPANVNASGAWVWPDGAQYPVKDGDVPYVSKPQPGVVAKTPEQLAIANAWRKGYWIVEAENYLDPGPRIAKISNGVMTELPARIVNGMPLYKSGDWGFPNMHAYAYQNKTFGIGFGFDGFCFTREGEAIGGSGQKSADQMFSGVVPQQAGVPPVPTAASAAPVTAPPVTAPYATATAPMPMASAPPLAPSSIAPPPGLPALPPIPGR